MSNEITHYFDDALNFLIKKKSDFVKNKVLTQAREVSFETFKQTGLPRATDEYWRFMSPETFISLSDKKNTASFQSSSEPQIRAGWRNIFFVDGVLDRQASDLTSGDDLEICDLQQEDLSQLKWVEDLYGKLEEKSQKKRPNGFAAYNTAGASEGVLVRIKAGKECKLHIHYEMTTRLSDSLIHNLIKLDPGAKLTLIENGACGFRTNCLMEIDILSEARLDHIRFFEDCSQSHILTSVFVQQAYKSVYKEFSLAFKNPFFRSEIWVSLQGLKSEVSLAGACIGVDENCQEDIVYVEHLEEQCESRQVFKKVLSNRAIGTFQGKIFVNAKAQKTDGYQISKGLLIDSDSRFLVKPELEIYADDVVCSHGSTSGALDEDSLFYLTSRGIEKHDAQRMLVFAFLDEAIAELEDDKLADEVRSLVTKKLELRLE